VDIDGDGSLNMSIHELSTCHRYNIGVKIVCINNQWLGMVRQWQELFFNGHYSGSILDGTPDFVKLAEAYGAVGLRASTPSDVECVLKEAIRIKKTVLIDFVVNPEENVYPMVPGGKGISEMILAEDL